MNKCLVLGCTETTSVDGDFLCHHCFAMLATGYVGEGKTFIHDLHAALLITAAMVDKIQNCREERPS